MPSTGRKPRGTIQPREAALGPELHRLREKEEALRRERIGLLKRELVGARERVSVLEKELRLAGVAASELRTRVSWNEIYDQLEGEFTVKELRQLTGASANLAASVIFRWRRQGRIRPVSRGRYRKMRH